MELHHRAEGGEVRTRLREREKRKEETQTRKPDITRDSTCPVEGNMYIPPNPHHFRGCAAGRAKTTTGC